ncbi:hypothetical protein MAC_04452 [Metarhizium acridum CQMa 102]|uniref:Uncharacterized protein n=1 Tax=Metarhizium acridum (strain CQMa 102) TaxID=655827 RepID=E9E3K8_METAQ|nr:uncharacterized protein MAC_04452 [Metarhizium acridum CQMa 102]EFY89433.1 hypothetical protein MAC_04452 [Metarhizium acridum CQMa 102]
MYMEASYSRLEDFVRESSALQSRECPLCQRENRTRHLIFMSGVIFSFVTLSAWVVILQKTENYVTKVQERDLEYLLHTELPCMTEPVVKEFGQRNRVEFIGAFEAASIWRGYPNDASDAAWKSVTDGMYTIPKVVPSQPIKYREKKSRGKLRDSSVFLSHNQQSGYMMSLEAFHQVHCLRWQDLLPKEPQLFKKSNIRTHTVTSAHKCTAYPDHHESPWELPHMSQVSGKPLTLRNHFLYL